MLTENDFKKYASNTHTLSIAAIDYINATRSTEPSRMVGTHAKTNVISSLISKKMGSTISVESRTAERAFFLLCEYDDRVIEIWDQPQPINIVRTLKSGVRRKGSYTPDFLILTKEGPTIIEVKTSEELKKLLIKTPEDWQVNSKGEYKYLPAYAAFIDIGLTHRIFVYSNKLRYLVANLETLMHSRQHEKTTQNVIDKILTAFDKYFVWSLYDLRKHLKLESYAPIIRMIDKQKLFFDRNRELITVPKGCFIATSKELLEQAKHYRDKRKLFRDLDTKHISILAFPTQKVAAETIRKLERVKNNESSSSVRKWKVKIREGEKNNLTPFQSLISRRYLSGNRQAKISKIVRDFLSRFIAKSFSKQPGISLYRSFNQYTIAAKEAHPNFDPVSYVSYCKTISKFPTYQIALQKGGKRSANAASEPTDPTQRSLKARAAWQSVAIDHCLADIYLVYFSSNDKTFALRPWITAMIDLCTSKVLAITISFQNPSRNSTAKVLRECVRRHGKLPSEIIVDRGSDFTSTYFASFLAHYGVTYTLRPSSHSRYGGEVEGFFGEFKKQWLSQRPGNMNDYKNARGVDGKKTPKNMAVLCPHDFYSELQEYTSWRDNKCRGYSHQSPSYQLDKSEKDFPFFGIPVEYNQDFLLASAVDSKLYTVDFKRGLHIKDFWYWHPDIGKIRGKKSKLEVRIDPENPHLVYALIENKWVSCCNAHINAYSAKDPVSQLVDGLLYSEVSDEKQKIRVAADEELAKMVKQIGKLSPTKKLKATADSTKEKSNSSKDKESYVTSIFQQAKAKSDTPVKLNYWGGKK